MVVQSMHGRRGLLAAAVLLTAMATGGPAVAADPAVAVDPAAVDPAAVDPAAVDPAAVDLAGSAMAGSEVAASEAVVPGDPITVDVMTVNGSGCPAGTASATPLADNTGFTVAYTSYVASANGSAAPTDFRKNCQLALLVHVPQGFTFAIAQADYAGTARLAEGATGRQRANYYFQGSSADAWSDHEFAGPLVGSWRVSDTAAALVYAPCATDRVLNVNTELLVENGTSSAASSLRMTSTSGGINSVYHFSWKQCS
jgi:hypothetical protein